MWEHGNIGQFWKGTKEHGPPLGDPRAFTRNYIYSLSFHFGSMRFAVDAAAEVGEIFFIDEKFYQTLMNQRHHLNYYIFIKLYKVCSKNWNKQRFVETRSVNKCVNF